MNALQYSIVVSACVLLAMLSGTKAAGGFTTCNPMLPECVKPYVFYDTQNNCTEETRPATIDCRWKAGLNFRVDEIAYGGRIIAYKLQWFNGQWSGWFVPGFNDIDTKYNTASFPCSLPVPKNGLRRAWAYFFDHTHSYVICRS